MKILGIIPARGGSKGIPDKNKKILGGKPLMQYTIEAALKATSLTTVVFSSEDSSLIEIAKQLGVRVPFKRPDHLATDSAGSLEVVQHTLIEMEQLGEKFDAICLLQVTTPFRTANDIDKAIKRFMDAHTDTLISVLPVPHQYNPHWVFEPNASGNLQIATGEKEIIKRRQELPTAYIRDGGIYITKTDVIQQQHSFYGNTITYVESDSKNHVNIDTLEDWEKAERLLE